MVWSAGEYEDESEDVVGFYEDCEESDEFINKCRKDATNFVEKYDEVIRQAVESSFVYSWEQAGCDFALTRNLHGVGFWDRDLGDIGDKLTDYAHVEGSVYFYIGDDGMIYSD